MGYRLVVSECRDKTTCPGVWADEDDGDAVVVVGEVLEPSPVPLGAGERAVRLRMSTLREAVAEA